jgi:hypothetical protein
MSKLHNKYTEIATTRVLLAPESHTEDSPAATFSDDLSLSGQTPDDTQHSARSMTTASLVHLNSSRPRLYLVDDSDFRDEHLQRFSSHVVPQRSGSYSRSYTAHTFDNVTAMQRLPPAMFMSLDICNHSTSLHQSACLSTTPALSVYYRHPSPSLVASMTAASYTAGEMGVDCDDTLYRLSYSGRSR